MDNEDKDGSYPRHRAIQTYEEDEAAAKNAQEEKEKEKQKQKENSGKKRTSLLFGKKKQN